ncbi:MAG: aminotransferase class V-fold PLP-dependent enzyme [Fuerstiella sp.]
MPSWPIPDEAVREAVLQMLQDGSWGRYHGPHCDALRAALAEFHRTEYVVLCSSGTAAVELALRAASVQPGDEVILAAYDYKANFVNVLTLQAKPVLVDTLPGLPILDPAQLKSAITDRTRAILCSHLHGSFARLAEIKAIAAERRIAVIEDACQAPGAILNTEVVGAIGDIGVLSFGGSKLLTAGRGGAILTRDATLAQRIRLYTQRGNDAYPLSEMQAAVLLPQLKQLAARNEARLQAVRRLVEQLPADGPLKPALDPDPRTEGNSQPAYYKVAFRYCPAAGHENRQDFSDRMMQAGIRIAPAFAALQKIHSRRRFRAVGNLENAAALHDQLMVLDHPVLLDPSPGLAARLSGR